MTLKQFETEFSILRGKIAQGIDPQEVTAQETGVAPKLISAKSLPEDLQPLFPEGAMEGTVGALLSDFLTDARSRLRPHTYRNYRAIARSYLLPRHGRTPLALMAEEDVRALLSEIARDRKAPKLAREVRKVLSCAFAWGKAHVPGVRVNPAQGLKLTGARARRDRWLTDSELVTLFRTLPRLEDEVAADLYVLVLASLCRPGEAFSMRAQDVTTISGERVWRLSDTKNGRDFLSPLQGMVDEIVARRMSAVGGEGYLFWKYSPQYETYPQQLTRASKQFRDLSGLGDVNPHDLRRTGRTHLSSLGVREEVAEAAMNDVKEELKATYNLYGYWVERKAALAVWHERLSALRLEALGQAA